MSTGVRALITGSSGFVGVHLARACAAAGDEVIGLSRSGDGGGGAGADELRCDLLDARATAEAVQAAAPDVVYHLAALASVGRSWEDPARPLTENAVGTLHLMEAVHQHAPAARVLATGSGEVYGPPPRLPVDEDLPLRPQSPYAVSKASADLLAGMYADAHGLAVVRARAFNHAGPGQSTTFVVSALARQVAEGRRAGANPIRVRSGNPDTRRDFTDVRDVARAYRLLAAHGEPGGIYNVCSGETASAGELVMLLAELAGPGVEIDHEVDGGLVRAHEVPEVRGSHERLSAATGWQPEIPLAQTVADTLAWWEGELEASTSSHRSPSGAPSDLDLHSRSSPE